MTFPELWTEKYRPKTLDEYVWRNQDHRDRAEAWIREGALPHLLFSGPPGTGKTSLAELLLIQLGIPKTDILKINASRERGPDEIQAKIMSFVPLWPSFDNETGIKYILLDEADAITPLAQKMLRSDMETYSDQCRVIFTANEPRKISAPIMSRVQHFEFGALDYEEFMTRIVNILDLEGFKWDVDGVSNLIGNSYPDLRRCINLAQKSCWVDLYESEDTGEITSQKVFRYTADAIEGEARSYLPEVINLFQSGRTTQARKLLVESATTSEYGDIFRYFYRNLDLWGPTEEQHDEALLAIRRAVVNHSIVADAEINLAALMVELTQISKR